MKKNNDLNRYGIEPRHALALPVTEHNNKKVAIPLRPFYFHLLLANPALTLP